MAQHKRTLRESLRSAMKHKAGADTILDVIADTQQRVSDLIIIVSADNMVNLAGAYAPEAAKSNTLSSDTASTGQHKRSIREVLRSSLAHKALADDILDSLEEIDLAVQLATAQLVTDSGGAPTGGGTYTAFATTQDDADATISGMQNKASRRRIMRSAVSHSRLGDIIVDSMEEMQSNINTMLTNLDAATGSFASSLTLTVIDPDAK